MAEGVAKANQANVGVGITGMPVLQVALWKSLLVLYVLAIQLMVKQKRRQYTLAISEETWSGRKAWSMF